MRILKHATDQPFVLATGVAALVHSTWALAVLFSGHPPAWDPTSWASWARWGYWFLPALLIAFALDVGQIATSSEIRAGDRSPVKYATFITFALATYYLQWIYIVHHMPVMELGAGVYDSGLAGRVVLMTRNAAIWFIPALLPMSTTMYTLSSGEHEQIDCKTFAPPPQTTETLTAPAKPVIVTFDANSVQNNDTRLHAVSCPDCDWSGEYDNALSARRALSAHKAHCPAREQQLSS